MYLVEFWLMKLTRDRRVLKEYVQPKSSTLQQAAVTERRAALHRRILNWQQIQTFYMPAVAELRTNQFLDDSNLTPTEEIPLYLPSACQTHTVIPDDLLVMEKLIRISQAEDALVNFVDCSESPQVFGSTRERKLVQVSVLAHVLVL